MEEEILEEKSLNEEESILHTLELTIYSVYARTDENNRVVKVFSDCFEQPQEGDSFLKSGSGDEFVHVGYYQLLTSEFAHRYKVVEGEIVKCTEEEIAEEIANRKATQTKPTIEESIAAIEDAICELSMRMN